MLPAVAVWTWSVPSGLAAPPANAEPIPTLPPAKNESPPVSNWTPILPPALATKNLPLVSDSSKNPPKVEPSDETHRCKYWFVPVLVITNCCTGFGVLIPTWPAKIPLPNEPVEVDEPLMFPLAVMSPSIFKASPNEILSPPADYWKASAYTIPLALMFPLAVIWPSMFNEPVISGANIFI